MTEINDGPIDEPTDVRSGEALDLGSLGPYLEEAMGLDGDVDVQQFPSGYSNLTYLLRVGDDRARPEAAPIREQAQKRP